LPSSAYGRGEIIPKARIDLIAGNGILGLEAEADGRFEAPLYPGLTYTLTLTCAARLETAGSRPGDRRSPGLGRGR